MSRTSCYLTAALLFSAPCGLANAQTSQLPAATKPAPAGSVGSVSARVENWTEAQWEAAKIEWAKDTAKWATCQKQWSDQKHEGRKNWPSVYKCMTGTGG